MDSFRMMEKVAEVAPEKYKFIVEGASEIKDGPFREEAIEELDHILKQAAFDWKNFGSTSLHNGISLSKGIAATALGGIGLALAGDAYDATRRAVSKTRNYKRMLASNPDLKEKPAAQVQSIFSTLHRFNPEFSSDPAVAGSFVRQHVELALGESGVGVGLDTAKSLVDSRKSLNESRRLQAPKLIDLEQEALAKHKLRSGTNKDISDVVKAQHDINRDNDKNNGGRHRGTP